MVVKYLTTNPDAMFIKWLPVKAQYIILTQLGICYIIATGNLDLLILWVNVSGESLIDVAKKYFVVAINHQQPHIVEYLYDNAICNTFDYYFISLFTVALNQNRNPSFVVDIMMLVMHMNSTLPNTTKDSIYGLLDILHGRIGLKFYEKHFKAAQTYGNFYAMMYILDHCENAGKFIWLIPDLFTLDIIKRASKFPEFEKEKNKSQYFLFALFNGKHDIIEFLCDHGFIFTDQAKRCVINNGKKHEYDLFQSYPAYRNKIYNISDGYWFLVELAINTRASFEFKQYILDDLINNNIKLYVNPSLVNCCVNSCPYILKYMDHFNIPAD